MIIETENLKKVYRTEVVETTAVNDVNFTLSEGQFVSVMGPSGCGKSTLLHLLGLIDSPSGGTYRFLGEDVTAYPERKRALIRKANIGFVFQSFNLIDELTVTKTSSCRWFTRMWPRTSGARASRRCSRKWISPIVAITFPRSSPVASSNAWPWRGRSSTNRTSFSPTSDGQPRFGARRRGHEAAAQAQRGRHDHPDGDPLGVKRGLQQSHRQPPGRQGRL